MPNAYTKKIKEKGSGDIIYPETKSSAVYLSNDSKTLDTLLGNTDINIGDSTITGAINTLQNSFDTLVGNVETALSEAYGSPLIANTIADMVDQTRVYVYTGLEIGYTAGDWYYWDGSAWTDGGIYNAIAVDTDTTLSVADKAADAKVTGDAVSSLKNELLFHPYGIEPFQMSLFKPTTNLFNDFCYHITNAYYRIQTDTTKHYPRAYTANTWQGWLIRVKPQTTYALGPVDFRIELLKSDGTRDVQLNDLSDTNPNIITTGSESYWLCLTQKLDRDMSGWMMVEGDTYPSNYISGYPQWCDVPLMPNDRMNHITFVYNIVPIEVVYTETGFEITIPASVRIMTDKGDLVATAQSTVLSGTTSQFIAYDTFDNTWKLGAEISGHEKYFIGYVIPTRKKCFLNANYVEIITKTIAFMGDSITAGVATEKCYHEFIHEKYGYTCLNYGYGGSGYYKSHPGTTTGKVGKGVPGMGEVITAENAFTPNNIVARLAELNPSVVDCIVIFSGTNEWGNDISIENFISGIEAAFDYCQTNYTNIPVLVMTPIHRGNDTTPNNQGKTLKEYCDILIDECRKYGIAYVDTMTVSGLHPDNIANRSYYFSANLESGIHPSIEGHKRIAMAIGEKLKEIIDWL